MQAIGLDQRPRNRVGGLESPRTSSPKGRPLSQEEAKAHQGDQVIGYFQIVALIEEKTSCKVAACDYTWSYIIHRQKSLAIHIYVLTSAAAETFDLAAQEQVTDFLSAISHQITPQLLVKDDQANIR